MKAKKSKVNAYAHLEKILTLAGLLVIIVGCAANLYGACANLRFIHDPIDVIYYFRYSILLAGGFAVGCLSVVKKSTRYNQLFVGVAYAVLAMTLYWLFDLARVSLQNLIGFLSYPWGKLLFMGMPLLSVIAASIVACFSQYQSNRSDLSAFTKAAIIFSFIVYQVYILASGSVVYDSTMPVWIIIGSYLINPLAIAIVSYLLFTTVQKWVDRLFYAVLVGMFYSTLTFVLWEFRTDPSSDATNIFSSTVTALAILFAGILLWRIRKKSN